MSQGKKCDFLPDFFSIPFNAAQMFDNVSLSALPQSLFLVCLWKSSGWEFASHITCIISNKIIVVKKNDFAFMSADIVWSICKEKKTKQRKL